MEAYMPKTTAEVSVERDTGATLEEQDQEGTGGAADEVEENDAQEARAINRRRTGYSRSPAEKKESILYHSRKKPELNPLHWQLRDQIKDVIYELRKLLDYMQNEAIRSRIPIWMSDKASFQSFTDRIYKRLYDLDIQNNVANFDIDQKARASLWFNKDREMDLAPHKGRWQAERTKESKVFAREFLNESKKAQLILPELGAGLNCRTLEEAWHSLEESLLPEPGYSLSFLCCKAQAALPPQASPASTRSAGTRHETEEDESAENEGVRPARPQVKGGTGLGEVGLAGSRNSKAGNDRRRAAPAADL
jgi:hypothetical protein